MKRAQLLLVLTLGISASAFAQEPTNPRDELCAAADAGELALRDLVARSGDDLVLDALAEQAPMNARLAATHACSALEAPELCLPALVAELTGRDPDLAPAAAAALGKISEQLSADVLARREASIAPLVQAAEALEAAAQSRALRADLRRMAGRAAAQLRAATVDGGPQRT